MNLTWTRRDLLRSGSAVALVAACPIRAAGNWREAASLPLSIQEIYPCLHQGALWLAGGLSADADTGAISISDRVVRFGLDTQEWGEASVLPEPRHHGFLVSTGSALLLFGGFIAAEGGQWHASRDIMRLDDEGWVVIGQLPTAQSETVTALYDGRIHLVGGRAPSGQQNANWNDQADMATHHVFDPATGMTETAAPLPMARNSAASFVIGSQWHVVGGRTVGGGNIAQHDIYDFRDHRWRTGAPLPHAQGGIAAANVGDRGYVFGGEYFSPSGGGVYKEVWAYEPSADAWRQMGEMPVPRHGLGAVAVGDSIYVLAGAIGAGGDGTSNRVSVFTP